MNKNKYIIRRILIFLNNGTKQSIKSKKEVYNVQSYREYLMTKYNAIRIEFVYDTIPAELQGKLVVKIKSGKVV